MNKLISIAQQTIGKHNTLPFYLYCAVHTQDLKNILITKPMLIVVINGHKEIGTTQEIACKSGEFILLSDHKLTAVRNIPDKEEYVALMIDFEREDFHDLPRASTEAPCVQGIVNAELQRLIEQFIEISSWAPASMITQRKREILAFLYHLGYQDIASVGRSSTLAHTIHDLFIMNHFQDMTVDKLCRSLFMSASTLRRKLLLERQSLREIKNNAQLGHALHLLQTTELSIQNIAEQVGYNVHSRFTESFKRHFGLTPSALRKTKQM